MTHINLFKLQQNTAGLSYSGHCVLSHSTQHNNESCSHTTWLGMFRRTVMAAVYFMSCKCKVVILAVFNCVLSISSFH